MSELNIEWTETTHDGLCQLTAAVLGYVVTIVPNLAVAEGLPKRFRSYYLEAGAFDREGLVIDILQPTIEDAKAGVQKWLEYQMSVIRPNSLEALLMSRSAPATERAMSFDEGLRYGMLFAEALVPLLAGTTANVTVSPCDSDGHSGLHFENKVGPRGVKVMSCARPGLVVMFMGTPEQLLFPWSQEPFYCPGSAIPAFARIAAQSCLLPDAGSPGTGGIEIRA